MRVLKRILEPLNKVRALQKIKKLKKYKEDEKIIYLLSPEHGNLGDQAIAIAIKKFLKDEYKNKTVIEFSYDEYMLTKHTIFNISNERDIIFIHGGGNLGNLYVNEEILRRNVIEKFKQNKIIIMPQSISFTEDDAGKIELENSKRIYNKHKNLYIVCRENKSFETAQKIFPQNNLILSPDSVMYLQDSFNYNLERRGVLMALRSDKEKVIDDLRINKIKETIGNLGEKITYKDTVINKIVNEKSRVNELEKILNSFGSSKLVITDRFHGAIFSVITRTPCIVFKSLDHKITEGIKWFKNMEYIYYAENDNNNLNDIIKEFLNMKVYRSEKSDNDLKNEFTKALRRIL